MAAIEACCRTWALGEIGCFARHIRVTDARFSGAEVGDLRLGQADRILELICPYRHSGLGGTQRGDGGGDRGHGLQSAGLGLDRDVGRPSPAGWSPGWVAVPPFDAVALAELPTPTLNLLSELIKLILLRYRPRLLHRNDLLQGGVVALLQLIVDEADGFHPGLRPLRAVVSFCRVMVLVCSAPFESLALMVSDWVVVAVRQELKLIAAVWVEPLAVADAQVRVAHGGSGESRRASGAEAEVRGGGRAADVQAEFRAVASTPGSGYRCCCWPAGPPCSTPHPS